MNVLMLRTRLFVKSVTDQVNVFEQIQKKYLALKQKNCLRGLGSVTLFKRLARGKYIVLKNPSD